MGEVSIGVLDSFWSKSQEIPSKVEESSKVREYMNRNQKNLKTQLLTTDRGREEM